jgi:hypothetical protein
MIDSHGPYVLQLKQKIVRMRDDLAEIKNKPATDINFYYTFKRL